VTEVCAEGDPLAEPCVELDAEAADLCAPGDPCGACDTDDPTEGPGMI
jgi:hypothetical protein